MQVRRRINVSGIVQGVGFRPYVYRLASERHLVGNIGNTSSGVTIEVQGTSGAIADFVTRLPVEVPALAHITRIELHDLPCNGDLVFRILASRKESEAEALISADVAICPDCLQEMFDPTDRRYQYPFINCTNCGPRFTIMRGIPYDRGRTSMAVFPMCPECQAEYDNPANRRFHAQPNACWKCGPHVELWDGNGQSIAEVGAAIREAAIRLRNGSVVAIKGLGGFHLAADATNPAAVARIRERKHRAEKPFAVMVASLDIAEQLCEMDDNSSRTLQAIERPIVLLPREDSNGIAAQVAPFNRYLGVFLPYTPLHHLLFAEGSFSALVMTSGNLSEEPIAIENGEAIERLRGIADCFLVHNRDILLRCDDSVVRVAAGKTQQLRRSRGYVPVPVFLAEELPRVLAVGGELKNTICLTRGEHAFLSQHIGDLENFESYRFFEQAVSHLCEVLEVRPEIVACDLHPGYFSTRWALKQEGVHLVGVQHHHAHIASCMAENHLQGRVIGIALDGTGYGADGHLWGGEVLVAGYDGFERAAHLEYVPMPGGECAIREPWRMAISYLAHHYGRDFLEFSLPFLQQCNRDEIEVVLRMVQRNLNSPLTSSCGRLFDAVAALVGIRSRVNYEAQAAIELEMAIAVDNDEGAYPFGLVADGAGWIIQTHPFFNALLHDLKSQIEPSIISLRFHNGLVQVFAQLARLLRQQTTLNRICLSGGTFQNLYLLEHLRAQLLADGFDVFTHSEVPAGDGGLCLGQAVVAAAQFKRHR